LFKYQKRQRRERIISWIIRTILILILAANVGIIYMEWKNGPEALEDMPYAFLLVQGDSMEPEYHDGDGVFVWQTPFEKLKLHDDIVFYQDGTLVTHRIIAIEDGVVTAQGTANDIEDEPVTEENYRAKVMLRIPQMEAIFTIYETPVLMIGFVVLLGLLLFGNDLFTKIYEKLQTGE